MITSRNAQYAAASSLLLLVLAVTYAAAPAAATPESNSMFNYVEFSTVIESEWATQADNNNTQKVELVVEPELEIGLNNDSRITAIGRLRTDTKDNISPGDHTQADLRELYLDTTVMDSIVIIGKQQVVWGKADGLKVLDVVNPQDFREFILDDFDQSRIPLWSVNAEVPINDMTLQLLWIPDQTYHELAEPGGTYAFTSPLIIPPTPAGTPVILNPVTAPDDTLDDADWGLRISTFLNGWDLTFNYLYHYDDTPALFRSINQTVNGIQVIINPEHKRSHLIGATFSNTFGDLTFRGEVGYSTDKYIPTTNPSDVDGVVKTGELKYVLGFDWYGFTDTLLSVQIFQTYLDNHETGMIKDQLNTQITSLIKQDYMNETLHAEILILQDIDYEDGMVRPKITYEYNDEVNIYAGADIFYGNEKGLLGQFKQTDRFISGIVIGF